MKTRLVGFLGLLSFVLCTSISQTAPARASQKLMGPYKIELKKAGLNTRDTWLFKPIPGLTIMKSQCSPGEISSPRRWDFGSGDSGGTICVPRCAPHYQFLSQSDETTVCRGFIEPGSGWVGDEAIIGGYTCRFMGDYPSDDVCPKGTSIHRYSPGSYVCHSDASISGKLRTCTDGFERVNNYYDRENIETGWRNYFACEQEDDPGEICTDPDAQLTGGGGGDNCCAYLK